MDLTKKQKIGLTTIIILTLFISSMFYFNRNKNNNTEVISKNTTKNNELFVNKEIEVYICGEVKKPGVYTLKDGDRLFSLLEKSGGITENADTSTLNLAQKLKDEDYIKVPNKQTLVNINGQPQTQVKDSNSKININTATKEQLEELPRIGESYATRIIEYRQKAGLFKDTSELKKVSGIGDKMFESIKDKICVR